MMRGGDHLRFRTCHDPVRIVELLGGPGQSHRDASHRFERFRPRWVEVNGSALMA